MAIKEEVRTIKTFIASDGKEFDTLEQAEEYEKYINLPGVYIVYTYYVGNNMSGIGIQGLFNTKEEAEAFCYSISNSIEDRNKYEEDKVGLTYQKFPIGTTPIFHWKLKDIKCTNTDR